jgi:hypothetical protein
VWQKCPGDLLNLRSMLSLDSFYGYTTQGWRKSWKVAIQIKQ